MAAVTLRHTSDNRHTVEFRDAHVPEDIAHTRSEGLYYRYSRVTPDVVQPLQLIRPCSVMSTYPLAQSATAEPLIYFEVRVLHVQLTGVVSIGLASASFGEASLPGYSPVSLAFVSDGTRCHSGKSSFACFPYRLEGFGAGDIVGCAYKPVSGSVFFTLNGVHLGEAFSLKPRREGNPGSLQFHAAVGADAGCLLECNLGSAAFSYGPANEAGLSSSLPYASVERLVATHSHTAARSCKQKLSQRNVSHLELCSSLIRTTKAANADASSPLGCRNVKSIPNRSSFGVLKTYSSAESFGATPLVDSRTPETQPRNPGKGRFQVLAASVAPRRTASDGLPATQSSLLLPTTPTDRAPSPTTPSASSFDSYEKKPAWPSRLFLPSVAMSKSKSAAVASPSTLPTPEPSPSLTPVAPAPPSPAIARLPAAAPAAAPTAEAQPRADPKPEPERGISPADLAELTSGVLAVFNQRKKLSRRVHINDDEPSNVRFGDVGDNLRVYGMKAVVTANRTADIDDFELTSPIGSTVYPDYEVF
ncbi:hypothetical protein DFJ73DRAFT_777653 [Zopfochytrium polystomum]|nr:hypothetical protein DFJ73DRAFT_777653 [Zopfochytrium polystomum]